MLLSLDQSDTNETESLSFKVITAVAEREEIDPMELEPPEYEALYDVINPEALDSLFEPRQNGTGRAAGQVTFSFCGYDVDVTSDGEVTLSEQNEKRL